MTITMGTDRFHLLVRELTELKETRAELRELVKLAGEEITKRDNTIIMQQQKINQLQAAIAELMEKQ